MDLQNQKGVDKSVLVDVSGEHPAKSHDQMEQKTRGLEHVGLNVGHFFLLPCSAMRMWRAVCLIPLREERVVHTTLSGTKERQRNESWVAAWPLRFHIDSKGEELTY